MNILITGGAGLVGSHAAEHWAAQGHVVTVLDNLMRSKLFGTPRQTVEYNWTYLAERRIRLVRGDVRNADEVRQAIGDGVDAVLHAAAQPGVRFSMEHPREDFEINALGTLQVLEAVRQRCPKATVLFCSTNKVYGTNVDRLRIQEDTTRYRFLDPTVGVSEETSIDLTGHTPYGVSKLAGELYMQDYAHTFGLRTIVFRMSCIYGPRQFGFEDQGWLAHFAVSMLCARPLTIYGDGKQVRDVLYVEDLVEAFDRCLASGVPHGVFNIGGGPQHTTSLLELLKLLEQVTGQRTSVQYRDWRPNDQRVYISDIRKISRAVGWEPRIRLVDGLERLVAWVTQHRDLLT